jgi:hypothetical protein
MDWTAFETPVRFECGTAVVPTEVGWLVQLPNEEFMHVDAEVDSRPVVEELLAGRLSPAVALAASPGAGIGDLLDALALEGALAAAETVQGSRVVMVGAGPPMSYIRDLLGDAGVHVELTGVGDLDGDRPDVVVAVGRWLPDADWRRLDAWSAGAGVAWHRAHAEGRRWYVGPFTIPGHSPSYEDLRLRRLAASAWPEDLLALWAWLDGGGVPATADGPRLGAVVAAALVVADVISHLSGAPIPGADVQVGVDAAAGTIRRHSVLAVPRHLVTESG